MVVGPCKALIPRFYYNAESGKCEPFDYGGCQGNANNFETLQECEKACGGGTAAGTGGSDGTSGTDGSGGAGGDGSCGQSCVNQGFFCCGNSCVNLNNDILNCGSCGNQCTGDNPYCGSGSCATPQSDIGACAGGNCCGNQCCDLGQLCCSVPGPVMTGLSCEQPTEEGTCPRGCVMCVCASPDTPIATPGGDRPIASLSAGDLVYSVHRSQIRAVPVLRTSRTAVVDHRVRRLTLANGAVLEISAGHPLADGRSLGELQPGELLDGVEVLEIDTIPYAHPFTYDILPDSESGAYFAGGVLMGSTIPR
jgi:hypothetical protein